MKTMLLERVLIPLDGSPAAETVVPLLEPILQRSGSEVFLVRALSPTDPDDQVRKADEYLRAIADRFQDDGLCAHAQIGMGSPSEVIETLAACEDVTLIALSAPADGVGPVMERLLNSAKPVLAFRPSTRSGLSRKKDRKTILAPLDGSEASRRSLPLALELAGTMNARVILMRVIEGDEEELEALHDLHGVAHRLTEQGLEAEIWIERGEPIDRILQAARDEAVEMVVMATRGGSGGPDDSLGRVTTQLMRRSPVPVLAVHVRGP